MKKIRRTLAALILAVMAAQPLSATALAAANDVAPPEAWGAVPNAMQLAYHQQELAAFCHFGMNTFTDKEWGDGQEDPVWFNPTGFHPDEWVKQLKDSGFGRLIVTAKHHDGFCIWPSEYTDHCVKSSPYGGDPLAEISAACTKYDLDMGLYLSPWDENAESYGYYDEEGNPLVDSAGNPLDGMTWEEIEEKDVLDYNDYYCNQIAEIAGNPKYGNDGRFVEWWMDGAKGSGADAQNYDKERIIATIRQYNPDILMFGGDGKQGIHWIGNEKGIASDNNWAKLDANGNATSYGKDENGVSFSEGAQNGVLWSVPECDVSLTQGWFYHEKELPKSMEQLADIYFRSVGHGAPLLLNIGPDREGRYPKTSSDRLNEFSEAIRDTFRTDLAQLDGVTAAASAVRGNAGAFDASKVIDGKEDTYWTMDDGQTTGSVTIDLGGKKTFDIVSIEEYIELGQRISGFKVETLSEDGQWQEFGAGRTVGAKRLVRGAPVTSSWIRVTITSSLAVPLLRTVGVFKASKGFELAASFPEGLAQLDDAAFQVRGNWEREEGSGFLNGTNLVTSESGARASFTFEGTKAYLIGSKGPAYGKFTVQVDGGEPVLVDASQDAVKHTQLLYALPDLEEGSHTVVIRRKSKKLALDAAMVLDNGGAGIFEIDRSSYTVDEGGSLEVKVNRTGGSKGEAAVNVNTPPGGAVQGQYYVNINETLHFAEGETSKTITVQTIDNNDSTGDLNFFFELVSAEGALVGFNKSANIVIRDNDSTKPLEEALQQTTGLVQAHYLPAGWKAMQQAKANAQDTLANAASYSQNRIDSAASLLREAVAALEKRTGYTADDPFVFPANRTGAELLEAEFFTLNGGATVGSDAGASGGQRVNSLKEGQSMTIPFTAKVPGVYTFKARVISGRTQDNPNRICFDGTGLVPGTAEVFGPDATQYQTVSFDVTVTQAGAGELIITGDSSESPLFDQFEVSAKEISLERYTITASSGENGSIEPAGEIAAEQYSEQVFRIRPDNGYEIKDVVVDGKSLGPVTSYTFEGVEADSDIQVSFMPSIYSAERPLLFPGEGETVNAEAESFALFKAEVIPSGQASVVIHPNENASNGKLINWFIKGSTIRVPFEAKKGYYKVVFDYATGREYNNPGLIEWDGTNVVPGSVAASMPEGVKWGPETSKTIYQSEAVIEVTEDTVGTFDLFTTKEYAANLDKLTITPTDPPAVEENPNLAPTAISVNQSDSYSSSYTGEKAVDKNFSSRWATSNGTTQATLDLTFEDPITVNSAVLDIFAKAGNAVNRFQIEYWNGTSWEIGFSGSVAADTPVAETHQKVEISFPAVTSDQIRLHITDGQNPSIFEFELYNKQEELTAEQVAETLVVPEITQKDAYLTYPAVPEGFEVDLAASSREDVVDLNGVIHPQAEAVTVDLTFVVTREAGGSASKVISVTVPALSKNIALRANKVSANNFHSASYTPDKAVDGDGSTRWATSDSVTSAWLELSFAAPVTVNQACIRQSAGPNNFVNAYAIEYWNGTDWTAAYTGGELGGEAAVSFEAFTSDRIRLNLTDAKRPSIWEFELFNEQREPADTDRTILDKVIERAQQLQQSDEYKNAIGDVRTSFDSALNSALSIGPAASQKEIDAAWIALMTEIHKLGIQQGSKEKLIADYELYKQLDLNLYLDGDAKDHFVAALEQARQAIEDDNLVQSEVDAVDDALVAAAGAMVLRGDTGLLEQVAAIAAGYRQENYTPSTWPRFAEALKQANELLADPNKSQEEIDSALDALISAMLDLRFRADKGVLEILVSQASQLDLEGYTPQSVEAFNRALDTARQVLDNPELSRSEQETVERAVSELRGAVEGLTKADGQATPLVVEGDGSIRTSTNSARTGDAAPFALVAGLLITGAAVLLRKKK